LGARYLPLITAEEETAATTAKPAEALAAD
jgi:hypothetical protein